MKIEERDVPLNEIDVEDETFQARFSYSKQKIENLARDIEEFGLREPIGIRKSPQDESKFQIIYGFQRTKACELLDRKFIKATIYENVTENECRELSVRDNEMHGDLSQVEKALQCHDLKENHGWTVKELCQAFNVKKSGSTTG